MGKQFSRPLKVMWLQAEIIHEFLKKRIEMYYQPFHHDPELYNLGKSNLVASGRLRKNIMRDSDMDAIAESIEYHKPDLVMIDRSATPTRVMLLELTVPWDSTNSFKDALDRKYKRYERLTEDLKSHGNMPLEIGCRGVVDSQNSGVLAAVCLMVGIRGFKKLQGALARMALLASYRIWLARRSQEWSSGELISPGQQ
jgi:hypothetical protein